MCILHSNSGGSCILALNYGMVIYLPICKQISKNRRDKETEQLDFI